ncbi:MAG: TIM barrel protein [Anaerolineae bacterium]|nr:TIM barrel protein [Anaerolineae bacterium]
MKVQYAISLWNYAHYLDTGTLEQELGAIRELGYGVELWAQWKDGPCLYAESERPRLKASLGGMPVTMHSAIVRTFEAQRAQIDTAQDLGAGVLVVHSDEFYAGSSRELDLALCRDVVAYARERGVCIALENGQLPFLEQALTAVEDLRICLDVGHVYLTDDTMQAFLAGLEGRIVHLHLQDTLTPAEVGLPGAGPDHYTPGTGGIPLDDWRLLAAHLQEVHFDGTAVFEIRPRNPYQTAILGRRFFDGLLPGP